MELDLINVFLNTNSQVQNLFKMPKKGYKKPKEVKLKISETMKRIGGNSGTWKKGQEAWNFKDGKRLKRKFKRFNNKLVLKSHYIFCTYHNILEIPKGFVIHHQDGNSLNDNIDNLILMKDNNHKALHNAIAGDELK